MTGLSAGSLCWFETGTTDSFGKGLAALSGGLGFVPGSHSPHYDGEATRRPRYHQLIGGGLAARRLRGGRWRGARVRRRASSSRSSRRGRTLGPTASSAARTGRPWRPSCRRATSAEAGASGRSADPRLRRLGRLRGLRGGLDGAGRVSTVVPQPGGTRPGARSASGARTNRRVAAAACGTSRCLAAFAGSVVGVDRAGVGWSFDRDARPPEHQEVELELARTPAPPMPPAELALQVLEPGEEVEGAGRGIRAGRHVEGDGRVVEVGLVGDADRARSRTGGTRREGGCRAAPRARRRLRPGFPPLDRPSRAHGICRARSEHASRGSRSRAVRGLLSSSERRGRGSGYRIPRGRHRVPLVCRQRRAKRDWAEPSDSRRPDRPRTRQRSCPRAQRSPRVSATGALVAGPGLEPGQHQTRADPRAPRGRSPRSTRCGRSFGAVASKRVRGTAKWVPASGAGAHWSHVEIARVRRISAFPSDAGTRRLSLEVKLRCAAANRVEERAARRVGGGRARGHLGRPGLRQRTASTPPPSAAPRRSPPRRPGGQTAAAPHTHLGPAHWPHRPES